MAETNENGNRNDGGEARILKQGFPVPTDLIGFIIGKKGANISNFEKATVPNCRFGQKRTKIIQQRLVIYPIIGYWQPS